MKKYYLRFKKWVEQKKIQKRLDKFMVAWIILIAIIFVGLLNTDLSSVLGLSTKKETPLVIFPTPTITIEESTPTPTLYIQPTVKPTIYIDPDPVESCTSKNSGDSIRVKRSDCQNKYVDCKINNTWKVLTTEKCKQDQDAYWKNYYNVNSNNTKPNTIPQITTEPSVTCVLSWGTYQLRQSSCDLHKKNDVSSNSQSAIATPDPAIQQQLQEEYQQYLEDQKKKEFENNQSNHGQCVLYANQWYTNQGTQCSGSCAEAIKQLAYPEYQAKLADCDKLYPIK